MLLQSSSRNRYQDGHPRFETQEIGENDKKGLAQPPELRDVGMCLRQFDFLDLILSDEGIDPVLR
jgi:hypothetical protein